MSALAVAGPEPFGKTVRLLWKAARRRARSRARHQRKLLRQKSGSSSNALPRLAMVLAALFMGFLHGVMGISTATIGNAAAELVTEQNGKLVVTSLFPEKATPTPTPPPSSRLRTRPYRRSPEVETEHDIQMESFFRQSHQGGSREDHEKLLRAHYEKFGNAGFVTREKVVHGLKGLRQMPPLAWLSCTFLFAWWFVMLTMQGEGLELDVQRRRHPMWEWLLSHPVRPEAAFLAEMVSPLVANPAYLTAPVFWVVLLSFVYPFPVAAGAGLVIGVLFAIAAAAVNKSLELCAMLKLSVRSRGAMIGLMSWLGYALFIIPLFSFGRPAAQIFVTRTLAPLATWFPFNPVAWLLGNWSGQQFAVALALLSSLGVCTAIITICALVCHWGTTSGLEGGFDNAPTTPRLLKLRKGSQFRREPLHRKELLWFFRDRSALVQAVLIPLTIAGLQAFNLRQLMAQASHAWSGIAGFAVISGTYFLIVLGPRSLASEGAALWIALTWPRGLEDLLKAKARLWWFLSSAVVFAVLVFDVVRFPHDAGWIALVAIGWCLFGRSLAEKSVTLVSAPSSSGEVQPVARSRQWSAMLGTLAFGSGILTRNWHLAIIGVVFSSLTAAAMWQNLRARLPFLYDPWSEKLPPPPTLLHSMVAIAVLVEGVALVTAIATSIGGPDSLNVSRFLAYGLGSLITYLVMQRFLSNRGIKAREVWNWSDARAGAPDSSRKAVALGLGIVGGVLLGVLAIGYRHVVLEWPALHEFLEPKMREAAAPPPGGFWWLAMLAIVFAPVAEEYLFRGMLFRALDREWGGVQALMGSAAFFAIYHPPISWLPVLALGLFNAFLFKKTRWLVPCVLCHMVYNALVVLIR